MHWLADIHSVRLGSSDLDASIRFATEILGLQLVRRDAQRAYVRASGERDYHLLYVRGDVRDEALAFEADSRATLEAIVVALANDGHRVHEATPGELDERRVGQLFSVTDPTGNRIEFVAGATAANGCTYTRDAGITSF